jgi:hypothetical protein
MRRFFAPVGAAARDIVTEMAERGMGYTPRSWE